MAKDVFEGIAPFVCDTHVHVGRFSDGHYFSPQRVCELLKKLGIGRWVVSSTSKGNNDFEIVMAEINAMLNIAPDQTLPLLWLTPQMLESSEDLRDYDRFPIYGFKIHGFMDDWHNRPELLRRVFQIAAERKLPVVLHTGGRSESEAGAYAEVCQEFGHVKTVLAHGRPVKQAIEVMKHSQNVFVDTAFMPVADIRRIVKSVGTDRILFGSDFPLDEYFCPTQSAVTRYRNRVNALVTAFGEQTFLLWNKNAGRVFLGESEG
jgi:predicted TIM-barrel fold metal-dependent hydrolase